MMQYYSNAPRSNKMFMPVPGPYAPGFHQTGSGFFGDVWDGIKRGASAVNDVLKSTKAVSTIAGLIPDGRAQVIGKVAGMAGYGEKKKKKKKGAGKQKGAGKRNVLGRIKKVLLI